MGFSGVFSDFPTIETERLLLREITDYDAEDFFSIWADQGVQEGLDTRGFSSIEGARKHLRVKSNAFKQKKNLTWGIVKRGSMAIVGACFYRAFEQRSKAELSYYLASPYWRQGIMTEALDVIVSFGFAAMELHRIQAYVQPDNLAAIRVIEKTGFRREGVLRKYHYSKEKGWVDKALYARLADA